MVADPIIPSTKNPKTNSQSQLASALLRKQSPTNQPASKNLISQQDKQDKTANQSYRKTVTS